MSERGRGRGGRGGGRGGNQQHQPLQPPSQQQQPQSSLVNAISKTSTDDAQSPASSPSATTNIANTNTSANSQPPIQLRKPVFKKVEELEPASHGHNLHVKVIDSKVVLDKPRPDGSRFIIHEALVGDDTGVILLTMRNEQSAGVSVGASLTVRNAKIEMFKGHMRLAVDQWGLIEQSAQPLTVAVNTENNLSNTEYELVET